MLKIDSLQWKWVILGEPGLGIVLPTAPALVSEDTLVPPASG
jgi:hypothetical protein